MMARARVELTGSLTHLMGGRRFKKGYPQYLSSPAEIMLYQSLGGFNVDVLQWDDKVTSSSDEPAEQTKPEPPAAEVHEQEATPAPEPPPAEASADVPRPSEGELRQMRKKQIQGVAKDLGLDPTGTTATLIHRIVTA